MQVNMSDRCCSHHNQPDLQHCYRYLLSSDYNRLLQKSTCSVRRLLARRLWTRLPQEHQFLQKQCIPSMNCDNSTWSNLKESKKLEQFQTRKKILLKGS